MNPAQLSELVIQAANHIAHEESIILRTALAVVGFSESATYLDEINELLELHHKQVLFRVRRAFGASDMRMAVAQLVVDERGEVTDKTPEMVEKIKDLSRRFAKERSKERPNDEVWTDMASGS